MTKHPERLVIAFVILGLVVACGSCKKPTTPKQEPVQPEAEAPAAVTAPEAVPRTVDQLVADGTKELEALWTSMDGILLADTPAPEKHAALQTLRDETAKAFLQLGQSRDLLAAKDKTTFDKQWGPVVAKVAAKHLTKEVGAAQTALSKADKANAALLGELVNLAGALKLEYAREHFQADMEALGLE